MQTPELNSVLFYVSDIDAAYNFFTNILGFEPVSDIDRDHPYMRELKGNGGIGFGLILPSEQGARAGDVEIYVKTDDIHAMREAIVGKGVELGPVIPRPFGQIVPVPAPDGFKIVAMGDPVAVS